MNYSVARKFLSTTSFVAIAVTMAGCSGEMERWGTPGSGYTSNQQEIFTNSTRSVPVQPVVNQAMPAAVTSVQQPQYSAPVYTTPQTVPVVSAQNAAPVQLVTNSIKPVTRTPVQTYQMPAPVSVQPTVQPVYQSVPVVVPVSSQVGYQPAAARPVVDYTSTGAVKQAALKKPPVVISKFSSMPKSAPRNKVARSSFVNVPAAVAPTSQRLPVNVPVATQAMPPKPVEQSSRFSISKFFSLPKTAPKQKGVDYRSTAAITPPASIPTVQPSNPVTQQRQQLASAAPISYQNTGSVRTSGQWTSAGGTMVTVHSGETIDTLSRRYGVPAKAIADVNGLVDQSFVAPGQKILIPVYQQNGTRSNLDRVASLPSTTGPASLVTPSVIRMPKANPLRMQSRTPYAQQIIRMQQNANAQYRHMVMPGDTLGGVASRYNVSVSDLARANRLSTNSSLRMGQRLHIPQPRVANGIDYTSTASINGQPTVLAPQTGASTLASPSLRLNRIPQSKPRQLVQTSLSVMKTQPTGPVAVLPKAKRKRVAALNQPVGLPDSGSSSVGAGAGAGAGSSVSKAPATAQPSAQAPKFRWPVRGRIISNFGRKRDGGRNDGINLAVPSGTSVRVAESGTVIYSGSKLKGYGNLVLVQHDNGWVTAYAHNSKILVSKGQQVRRGQIIAQAGKTGSVDSPQLHFELRIKGDPVDPVPHLVAS